jgi:hypothetical protein
MISSLLTISLVRFDQFMLPNFFEKEIVAKYLTLVRLYEPYLTFMQILGTYLISKINVSNFKLISMKYHSASLVVIILLTAIVNFVVVPMGILEVPTNYDGTSILMLLSLLYLFNSSRVWFGKLMVFFGYYKLLMIRVLIGGVILSFSFFFTSFNTLISLIVSMILAILAMNVFSIQLLLRKL